MTRRLTLPLALEGGRAPGVQSAILTVSSLAVCSAIVWASLTRINELTIAPGQLRPAGAVYAVQHLEGGQVAEILAGEGQVIEKGAPLVRLSPATAESDLGQLSARLGGLAMKIERYTALIEGRDPSFGDVGDRLAQLVVTETSAFENALGQYRKEKASLEARIEQRAAEIASFRQQAKSLERQVELQEQQLAMRSELVKNGYVSKAVYIELQRTLEKTNEQLIAIRGQLEAAQETFHEATIKLAALESEFKRRASEERSTASAEFAELREGKRKHEDRVARLVVRAPVKGMVQELVTNSLGQVVRPGELVAKIVPFDEAIVAEVQVRPEDIGHVKPGDRADVKVSTFDFVRFGTVGAMVRHISPTTFQTEDGKPYYKAVLSLESNHLSYAGRQHLLLPGMVVQAEIVTGAKSLMQYLLKPVYVSLSTAFSQR